MTHAEVHTDIQAWRHSLDHSLQRKDGWLALAGLHWLAEGTQLAGSAPSADVRLPASTPARLGMFELRDGEVRFQPDPGAVGSIDGLAGDGAVLRPDSDDEPSFLRLGEVTLVVIARGARRGLRVWDNARPERLGFPGRSWYPIEPGFRLPARFTAGGDRTILIPNQIGDQAPEPLMGTAEFVLAGAPVELAALDYGDGRPWFLFGDATNGAGTYPAGRFLIADAPADEHLVLDFNRAYNPPCAFTPYATCPLPPEGNRLGAAIEAGERFPPAGQSRADER